MILNQLVNHVREMILALRTEYIEVPDTITQILDSFARYKAGGAAGLGVSIPSLLKRGRAFFYGGLDEAQQVEDNRQVERHFAYWKELYIDAVLEGSSLKMTTGLTVADLVRQDYALGHMNETDRLMLLNEFDTAYKTAAAGLQEKKVGAVHGNFLELTPQETQRKPETLDDLFNPDGPFHGIGIADLGSWDNAHVWGRRPISNVGTAKEQKYRNRPQIYKFASPTTPTIANLEPILRRYGSVVKSGKLGYMWEEGFSKLVQDILSKNLNVPSLILGTAGWEFDMDCVKIAGTTIISDPNAEEGTLRVLNVGTPGAENGTVFPFYYDPMTEPVEYLREQARMLSENRNRPKNMTFGRPRQTPYFGSEWQRGERYVDAVYTRCFLQSIPILCLVRGHQLEVQNLTAS